MRGLWLGVALAGGLVGCGDIAAAQGAKAPQADAVAVRKDGFKAMGAALKRISDEARRPQPDRRLLVAEADRLSALSAQLPGWFAGPEAGRERKDSQARREIWSDPQGFSDAARGVREASRKLRGAAATGDARAVRAQLAGVSASCKACHDRFRGP